MLWEQGVAGSNPAAPTNQIMTGCGFCRGLFLCLSQAEIRLIWLETLKLISFAKPHQHRIIRADSMIPIIQQE
jgi:hypothetical protein